MAVLIRQALQRRGKALDVPALPPPEGIISNFDNPPNNNSLGYGILSAMLAIASVVVFLRISSRIMATRRFRFEDCMYSNTKKHSLRHYSNYTSLGNRCICSSTSPPAVQHLLNSFTQGLFVTYLACAYHALEFPGFYVHQWNVRLGEIPRLQYWFYVASNAYNAMIGTLKRIWDPTITIGHCYVDANGLYLAGTIINLISDLAILVTPQRVIWRLNMTRNKKLGISFIFAIGILCCGIATARIVTTVTSASILDATYNLPLLVFLGTSEMLCALLVFCVPAIPLAITTLGVNRLYSHISSLLSTQRVLPSDVWHSSAKSSRPSKMKSGERGKPYQEIDQFSLEPTTVTRDGGRSGRNSFQ
ncbi:hypothetical protein F4859DRAFT_186176 [Xylaria cf. heliscus]|nr:hypothetical protein F4859DRAFT_186176 [Xylaria cf. heliscus]